MNYVSVILCCNEMVATKKSFIILFAMYRGVEVINSVKKYMIVKKESGQTILPMIYPQ